MDAQISTSGAPAQRGQDVCGCCGVQARRGLILHHKQTGLITVSCAAQVSYSETRYDEKGRTMKSTDGLATSSKPMLTLFLWPPLQQAKQIPFSHCTSLPCMQACMIFAIIDAP
jgi:hypothetical protein